MRTRWIKSIANEWCAIDLALIVFIRAVRGGDAYAGHITGVTLRPVEMLVRQDLSRRTATLAGLASSWKAQGGTSRQVREADGAHLTASQGGYLGLEWVDSDAGKQHGTEHRIINCAGEIRWVWERVNAPRPSNAEALVQEVS